MIRSQAGGIKAPVVFLVIVIVCVAGLVAVKLLGGPARGHGDNQAGADNQQAVTFTEDFTGETLASLQAQGWSVWYKPAMPEVRDNLQTTFNPETLSVENGMLAATQGAGGFMYSANWGDYTLTFKFKVGFSLSGYTYWCGLAFRNDSTWENGTAGQAASGSWPRNSYILQLGYGGSTNNLWKIVNGVWASTPIASKEMDVTTNDWYNVTLVASGSSLKVYLDNQSLFDVTDSSLTSGGIGLLNCSGPFYFDDVVASA